MALTKAKLIADGVIDVDNLAAGHSITTSNIGEGSNLYYTDGRVASYLTTNSYATESFVTTGYLPLSGGTVSGNLTVTGSLTGTLATAAQTNITSVGTLSSLAVNGGLQINGSSNISTVLTDSDNSLIALVASSSLIDNKPRIQIIGTTFASDPNTIQYLSGGHIFKSSAAATEYMRITSAGNVGIGTSSPTNPLVVNAGGGIIEHRNNADLAELHIRPNATKSGYITFTESAVADRWALGISNGDGSLHFRVPYPSSTPKVSFLSGGGITFNGDTAAANALDDYEEGTWTPQYTAEGGSIPMGTAQGYYTKIGNQVTLFFNTTSNSISSPTGAISITGLPFTSNANSITGAALGFVRRWLTDMPNFNGTIFGSSSTIFLYKQTSNSGSSAPVSSTDLSNNQFWNQIIGSITYFV